MNNSDMPASPIFNSDGFPGAAEAVLYESGLTSGLTKRETFAMAAMQGLLANSEPNSWNEEQWYKQFSSQAVNHADALLKELEK